MNYNNILIVWFQIHLFNPTLIFCFYILTVYDPKSEKKINVAISKLRCGDVVGPTLVTLWSAFVFAIQER